ncbi:DUF2637 domain-containing protein [Streptomyces zhihengii]
MKRLLNNPSRALAVAAGVVIIALTVAAFWLSYAHLAEVALSHGLVEAEVRAWAWPATVDLFIVAGELMWLRAALAHRVDVWAIVLTAVGSLGSIVLNVAGVTGARAASEVPLLDYVVAAVPPTAALLAFGALMRQVHQALAGHVDEPEVIPVLPPPVTVERVEDDQPSVALEPAQLVRFDLAQPSMLNAWKPAPKFPQGEFVPRWTVTTPEPAQLKYRLDSFKEELVSVDPVEEVTAQASAVPAEQTRQVVTETVALSPTELRKKARALHRQAVRSGARGVTIEQLRDELNLSRREATALRREVVTEGAS